MIDTFARAGIAAERVSVREGIAERRAHLALYNEIDIALDTYPYNGATTTCEALWMGVPVVTLAGETHAARMGASLLSELGLAELIAHSVEDYVAAAVRLAAAPGQLAGLHATLRQRFAASPLRDEAGFARAFEHAVRAAWQERAAI